MTSRNAPFVNKNRFADPLELGPVRSSASSAPSQGLLGNLRRRLLALIDGLGPGPKVAICDAEAAAVLHTAVRMHELVDHNLVLVEDLFQERQPLIGLPAVYIIAPAAASIDRVLADWSVGGLRRYAAAFLFFIRPADDEALQRLASAPALVERLGCVEEAMIDFTAMDPLLFHCGLRDPIPGLFPVSHPRTAPELLARLAAQLVCVFHTLDNGPPLVRYHNTSAMARLLAVRFSEVGGRFLPPPSAESESPLLLLVDRSFDLTTVLTHNLGYQALVEDFELAPGGCFVHEFRSADGTPKRRELVLDELDPYWCEYRHRPFVDGLDELPRRLRALAEAQRSSSKLHPFEAMGMLPSLQRDRATLAAHLDLGGRLLARFQLEHLGEVCRVEQKLLTAAQQQSGPTSKSNRSSLLEAVQQLARDSDIPVTVGRRLQLLAALVLGSTSHAHFDDAALATLEQLRSGTMVEPATRSSAPGEVDSMTKVATAVALPAPAAFSLRPKRSFESAVEDAKKTANTTAASSKSGSTSRIAQLLTAAANRTLSFADFPVLGAATERVELPSAARPVSAVGFNSIPSAAKLVLDLGAEGSVPLKSRQRIVLFVIGGVTFSEAREAYQVVRECCVEIIIGGSSLLRPEEFIQLLSGGTGTEL